jgi:predicted DNA-binding transcriptional regulator YafY
MRASRLVQLLLLLQSRGRLTARVLAEELEVSERTIHRDVDALSAAGIPIYAERGPHGGIQLVDGYRTRLTGLTGEEAEALFLSGLPGPAAELGLGTVVAAARLKLLASLPSELRARASRLVERFHLDAAGWFQASESVPHLAVLADAVWESRRLQITYRRGESAVDRIIDPLGLVLKAGVWYVVALAGDQVRTYRARRIRAALATGETFDRPPGFELARHWTDAIAAYERDTPRLTLTLDVEPGAIGMLANVVGERALREAERLGTRADGWTRLRMSVDWPEEVPGRLVAMGSHAEIVEPGAVREEATAMARGWLARHDGPSRDPVPVAAEMS